ncbi:hypothetical protein HanIR_Chr07g0302351 [Helianthus annuus]|nr:hypothetical protein HanIR_Chr07g0302351 [Helianthus annuus]
MFHNHHLQPPCHRSSSLYHRTPQPQLQPSPSLIYPTRDQHTQPQPLFFTTFTGQPLRLPPISTTIAHLLLPLI